jgi:catechol 2,3-dioxygenase-like lactoylglutathione lyase family enzyme
MIRNMRVSEPSVGGGHGVRNQSRHAGVLCVPLLPTPGSHTQTYGATVEMTPLRPSVNRVLETSLYVHDLGRSIAFYQRVFSFEAMFHDERMCAMAVPDRQVLLLFRKGGSVHASQMPFGVIPPHDGSGALHLCFSIDYDALGAWRDHLRSLDIAIESEVAWPGRGISLYFRDPDGHALEVATPGLWPNDPLDH